MSINRHNELTTCKELILINIIHIVNIRTFITFSIKKLIYDPF